MESFQNISNCPKGIVVDLLKEAGITKSDIKYGNNSIYGQASFHGEVVFLKIIASGEKNKEIENYKLVKSFFRTPSIVGSFDKNGYSLLVFKHINNYGNKNISGEVLLHSKIGTKDKFDIFSKFYSELYSINSQSIIKKKVISYPSDVLFEKRITNGRLRHYYGEGALLLKEDMINYGFKFLCKELDDFLCYKNEFEFITINHGDLHDMNYRYVYDSITTIQLGNFMFCDLSTMGENPVLGDIACHYRYSIFQSTYFIPKYDPNFLNIKVTQKDIDARKEIWPIMCNNYIYPTINLLMSIDKNYNWKMEFWRKMLFRMLLVHNILTYESSDRIYIYELLKNISVWKLSPPKLIDLPFNDSSCFL